MSGFRDIADRLYRGEAGLNIVGKRKLWFGVAGGVVAVALILLISLGFKLGIEFTGGNEFKVPATSGSLEQVEDVFTEVVTGVLPDAQIKSGQQVGTGNEAVYSIETSALTADQATQVKQQVAQRFGLDINAISDSQISGRWGEQVTENALWSLVIFLAAVTIYLSFRFEWRMAAAAVASLIYNLIATAAVYAISGFVVTPSTVIGFLTILGFALYDVVVVFDKVQENTRGITGKANETYAEATNLALNQTLMRSINTSLVALLPVGGMLFIGAGLLGAGTLKDLALVLFIGMGMAVFSSLFFASPFLVWLKEMEPAIANHTKRVLARRAGLTKAAAEAGTGAPVPAAALAGTAKVATSAPKAGAKPAAKPAAPAKSTGKPVRQGGRSGGGKRR